MRSWYSKLPNNQATCSPPTVHSCGQIQYGELQETECSSHPYRAELLQLDTRTGCISNHLLGPVPQCRKAVFRGHKSGHVYMNKTEHSQYGQYYSHSLSDKILRLLSNPDVPYNGHKSQSAESGPHPHTQEPLIYALISRVIFWRLLPQFVPHISPILSFFIYSPKQYSPRVQNEGLQYGISSNRLSPHMIWGGYKCVAARDMSYASQYSQHRLIWVTLRVWHRFQDGRSLHKRRCKYPISRCFVSLYLPERVPIVCFLVLQVTVHPAVTPSNKMPRASTVHIATWKRPQHLSQVSYVRQGDTYRIDCRYITNVKQVILLNLNADNKCRRRYNEELHKLYSSPNIIRMIKSRRMRWAGYVAWMGRTGMHIGYWWESQKERDH
jgi:hypothetical protein